MFRFSGKVVSEKYHIRLFEAVRLIFATMSNEELKRHSYYRKNSSVVAVPYDRNFLYFLLKIVGRLRKLISEPDLS